MFIAEFLLGLSGNIFCGFLVNEITKDVKNFYKNPCFWGLSVLVILVLIFFAGLTLKIRKKYLKLFEQVDQKYAEELGNKVDLLTDEAIEKAKNGELKVVRKIVKSYKELKKIM